jgi:hypothetical protein
MVTKGVKVLSVVAYRKGNVDLRTREAKEGGTGQVSFGVIDGSAANIVFKVTDTHGHVIKEIVA